MANPEHLKILKQGVKVWNEWRELRPEVWPDLVGADLRGLDLSGVNFLTTDLREADLANCKLKNASLTGSILISANLTNADLRHADLYIANLNGAMLTGADLTFALMGVTVITNNDLRGVHGLEKIRHNNQSHVGIDTIYRSQGDIPESFLRGCGVPDSFIVQMRALVASAAPIQFYTCFISFTEADDAFSERLYNDFQGAGVRCWRWKEDAKWGKTLMRSIDEAVRVYDKLIIICSEQSLNSPAVIREIERALQKEDDLARQGKEGEVLFPIRLDDHIFTGWNHHRKADVIAKNVGDFRKWKDHDSYSEAFARLLRDLKAEDKQTAEG